MMRNNGLMCLTVMSLALSLPGCSSETEGGSDGTETESASGSGDGADGADDDGDDGGDDNSGTGGGSGGSADGGDGGTAGEGTGDESSAGDDGSTGDGGSGTEDGSGTKGDDGTGGVACDGLKMDACETTPGCMSIMGKHVKRDPGGGMCLEKPEFLGCVDPDECTEETIFICMGGGGVGTIPDMWQLETSCVPDGYDMCPNQTPGDIPDC